MRLKKLDEQDIFQRRQAVEPAKYQNSGTSKVAPVLVRRII
jgi:hypothetical protein